MSVLDSDRNVQLNKENDIKDRAIKEETWAVLLCANVSEIETDINPTWKKIEQTWHVNEGSSKFVSDLVEILKKENNPLNPMLRPHLGRPVYTLDCRCLHKGDAIGWLEKVSNLPKTPEPILVIENITDIPEEDNNHEAPQYVRNILMHNWENVTNNYYNVYTGNSFSIDSTAYKIFITWPPEKRKVMDTIHEPSNGFAWVGNLEEFFKELKDAFKKESVKDLEETHIISYEQ